MREVVSFLSTQLAKFCLNSGVSVPSRKHVTLVHDGYPFCSIKSCNITVSYHLLSVFYQHRDSYQCTLVSCLLLLLSCPLPHPAIDTTSTSVHYEGILQERGYYYLSQLAHQVWHIASSPTVVIATPTLVSSISRFSGYLPTGVTSRLPLASDTLWGWRVRGRDI